MSQSGTPHSIYFCQFSRIQSGATPSFDFEETLPEDSHHYPHWTIIILQRYRQMQNSWSEIREAVECCQEDAVTAMFKTFALRYGGTTSILSH